jgi:hypothetical protein
MIVDMSKDETIQTGSFTFNDSGKTDLVYEQESEPLYINERFGAPYIVLRLLYESMLKN